MWRVQGRWKGRICSQSSLSRCFSNPDYVETISVVPVDGGSATPPCVSLIGFDVDIGDRVDMVSKI